MSINSTNENKYNYSTLASMKSNLNFESNIESEFDTSIFDNETFATEIGNYFQDNDELLKQLQENGEASNINIEEIIGNLINKLFEVFKNIFSASDTTTNINSNNEVSSTNLKDEKSAVDTNNDGKITQEEYDSWAYSNVDISNLIDTNNDGKITKSELEAYNKRKSEGALATKSVQYSKNTTTATNENTTSTLTNTATSTNTTAPSKNTTNEDENGINEKIEYSQQGETSDCWLLSGLNALSSNEKGAKIIADSISTSSNGNYIVTFKGINKQIEITEEELNLPKIQNIFSSGDKDVLLMEIAFEKAYEDIVLSGNKDLALKLNINGKESISLLDGGNYSNVIYMLTGEEITKLTDQNDCKTYFDNYGENSSACLNFFGTNGDKVAYDVNGAPVVLTDNGGGHGWSVKSVDNENNTVTIINPWDSSQEYVFDKDELCANIGNLQYYNC